MKLISNAFSLFIIIALAVIVFHGKPNQQAARDLSEDDLFCMVQNVYHEARGEDALGQAAVAHVTLNRVARRPTLIRCAGWYGSTISSAGQMTAEATG